MLLEHPRDVAQMLVMESRGASNGCEFKPRMVHKTLLKALGDQPARTEDSDFYPFHASARGLCPLRPSEIIPTARGRFVG